MIATGSVRTEPLSPHHERDTFACGEAALDRYLRTQAGQDDRRRVSRVFVAVEAGFSRVIGFHALSATAIDARSFPAEIARRLPKYPVPVALLGRLAVDLAWQGRGLGDFLVADAVRRVASVGEHVAIHSIVVEAMSEKARAFYERFGFRPLTDDGRRLFLLLTPGTA